MIQRIQTVYLLVIAILMIVLLFVPIAQVVVLGDGSYNFYTYGVVQIGDETTVSIVYYWALLTLSVCTIVLPLLTVFLYKKRFVQIRLCIVEIILLIGSLILMWYHIHQFGNKLNADVLYKFGFILPVMCIILTYMAIQGILKDIKLLKSYDRIR